LWRRQRVWRRFRWRWLADKSCCGEWAHSTNYAKDWPGGKLGNPAESLQIVLSGEADPMGHGLAPPNRIRWALTRA
jgi:hypothetical protein